MYRIAEGQDKSNGRATRDAGWGDERGGPKRPARVAKPAGRVNASRGKYAYCAHAAARYHGKLGINPPSSSYLRATANYGDL